MNLISASDTLHLSLNEKFEKYYGFADGIVELSDKVNETNLELLAAIVVLLVGTEKVKPLHSKIRYIYFVLFPSTACLIYSLYLGTLIKQYAINVKVFKYYSLVKDTVYSGTESMTNLYITQNNYMLLALCLMAMWLLVYFAGWFFSATQTKAETKND